MDLYGTEAYPLNYNHKKIFRCQHQKMMQVAAMQHYFPSQTAVSISNQCQKWICIHQFPGSTTKIYLSSF